MNTLGREQVVAKTQSPPKGSSAAVRWLRRLGLIVLLTGGCFFLASFWYEDVVGRTDSPPGDGLSSTVESVESKLGDRELLGDIGVPAGAITAGINQELIDAAEHPLIPLLEMAQRGVEFLERHIPDYTANITKQIRWNGKLQPEQSVFCKIRHPRTGPDSESIPFSVYTRFNYPKPGQEVIWVQGWNDDKLVAHGPKGLMNLLTLHLDPEGSMAMNGNRYPIMSIGMLNLIKVMIEKGKQDLDHEDCRVVITRQVVVGDIPCTRLEVIHEQQLERFEYHRAEIYIDDNRNLPIAFRSFIWPEKPGETPRLLEKYHYTDIQLNVGLTDADFDPANEAYDFPGY